MTACPSGIRKEIKRFSEAEAPVVTARDWGDPVRGFAFDWLDDVLRAHRR